MSLTSDEKQSLADQKRGTGGWRPPKITMGPSKNGSQYCANAEGGRNGSIASGGTIEYSVKIERFAFFMMRLIVIPFTFRLANIK